jgi:hypothetical protein
MLGKDRFLFPHFTICINFCTIFLFSILYVRNWTHTTWKKAGWCQLVLVEKRVPVLLQTTAVPLL